MRNAGRVVLLGGKPLAIGVLERMAAMPDVEVVAVVPCADDDPSAEHWYPSLARHARGRGLPLYQRRSVNQPAFLPILRRLQPDVLLSVFYDKILKPDVLALPTTAAVNIHFGLLPYNRGSFPIPWAIIDGNDPGVTMHHMDPGVDTGDIIAQTAVPAGDFETARDIYERCTAAGLCLFERSFPLLLQGRAPRRPQREGGTYYRTGYPFDRWIDWSQNAEAISRFVRALTFPPFPGARTALHDHELELCYPAWPSDEAPGAPPGTLLEIAPQGVTVAAGEGSLHVRALREQGVELPAAEAVWRAGGSPGDRLESVPWARTKAA